MAIKSTHLLLFLVVCVAATTVIGKSINRDVTYEEVLQSTNNPNVLLVDVRSPDEIEETGIIPSAINIPLADFRNALSHTSNKSFLIKYNREKPDLDSHIIIYCTLGVRAQEALDIALELGYHNAKRYPGSWKEWAERQKADPTQIATS